jgi:uncharacterized integral membrane protein
MRIKLILALVLALIVTIFAVQNYESIEVSFLMFELRGSLALILLVTLVFGIAIGWLMMAPSALKRQVQAIELKRDKRRLEGELEKTYPDPEITSEE